MVCRMKKSNKIRQYLRFIHRDLGYLFVGVSIIYGLSGILLNHKVDGENPAYKSVDFSFDIKANMDLDAFKAYWAKEKNDIDIKRIVKRESIYVIYLDGGTGTYTPLSGKLKYQTYTRNDLYYFVTQLHYNSQKGWMYMADVFAVVLIIFAISGMFMVPGKNGIKGRGKYLVIIGIIIPFLFFL